MATPGGPSVRADARRRYVELASAQGLEAATPAASAGTPAPTPLTAYVRTLYEETVLPVREIARLAGVTERTIYKYARKLNWRPRVVRLGRGTGGRFIPLAEAGRPVATGIKALDPEGAARAAYACVRAGMLSGQAADAAVAAARERAAHEAAERTAEARARTLCHLLDALATLAAMRADATGADAGVIALTERLGRTVVACVEKVLAPG